MKHLKLIAVTVGLILVVNATAGAVSLSVGPQEAKFDDYTSVYWFPGGGLPGVPYVHPGGANIVAIAVGDENRAIFNITTITPDVQPAPAADFSGDPNVEQLSGMFYDLTALAAVQPPPIGGSVTVEWGDGNRNGVAGRPQFTGGVLEIYQDVGAVSPFNALAGGGPGAWVESDPAASVPGRDSFPTVNQGAETLWLQCVFIPFPGAGNPASGVGAGTLVRESFTNIAGATSGSGSGYAMVIGGTYAQFIEGGSQNLDYAAAGWGLPPAGLSADLYLQFVIDPYDTPEAPPWLATSDDPVKFSVVPEPITMLGLFLGVGSLAGYIRKRKLA